MFRHQKFTMLGSSGLPRPQSRPIWNVIKTIVMNYLFGNGSYHFLMVIWGIIHSCSSHYHCGCIILVLRCGAIPHPHPSSLSKPTYACFSKLMTRPRHQGYLWIQQPTHFRPISHARVVLGAAPKSGPLRQCLRCVQLQHWRPQGDGQVDGPEGRKPFSRLKRLGIVSLHM